MAVAWCRRTRKADHMQLSPENPFRAFLEDLYHDHRHHERAAEHIRQQIIEAEESGEQWETRKDEAE